MSKIQMIPISPQLHCPQSWRSARQQTICFLFKRSVLIRPMLFRSISPLKNSSFIFDILSNIPGPLDASVNNKFGSGVKFIVQNLLTLYCLKFACNFVVLFSAHQINTWAIFAKFRDIAKC